MPDARPYGTWPTPVDPALAAASSVMVSELQVVGQDAWWLEQRPAEDGRTVAVQWREGRCRDMTPTAFDVRTRVHEYGGGAMRVAGGHVYLARDPDGTIWRMATAGGDPTAITKPEDGRFADFELDAERNRLLAVREPAGGGGLEARTTIATIDLGTGAVTDLVSGPDFVASPRLSPRGDELAWIEWNHPDMPWDATCLRRATLDRSGALADVRAVAGGHGSQRRTGVRTIDDEPASGRDPGDDGESVAEPRWTPGGELMFLSDRDGWWSLYRDRPGTPDGADAVLRTDTDLARPAWKLGMRSWAIAPPRGILAGVRRRGRTNLVSVSARRSTGRPPRVMDDSWARVESISAGDGMAAMLVTHPSRPTSVVRWDLLTDQSEVLREMPVPRLDEAYLAEPEMIEFPGAGGDPTVAWTYAPAHPEWTGPEGARPPLLVRVHGGPTGWARLEYDLELRYWTSRGWAVCDVDYGGSAGYGRAYRRRLHGRWGEVDVADCVAAVDHLVDAGRVDGERVAITGGSAGGYTTLMALATTDRFAAGASRFGIADLVRFRETTHRFESRYLDGLLGPWPEAKDVYRDRSPINRLDGLTRPLAVFQGQEDRVVPPEQADLIVNALEERNVPVSIERFEGEQHGFRKQSSLQRTLVVMDRFFRDHLGIRDPQT